MRKKSFSDGIGFQNDRKVGTVMSDISMIGMGAMGTALAKAQLKAGHEVTVWNRSPQKMTPLMDLGAKGAQSVAAAVEASPLIMICIDNYTGTNALLQAADVVPHLSGQSVIQLGTGTPSGLACVPP